MGQRVNVKVLPDGTGRVRIHWFVRDPKGPIETPASPIIVTALGPMRHGGVRGYIACNRALKDVTPQMVAGALQPTAHSDDPRAATCPECKATPEYQKAIALLAETLETASA